MDGYAGKAIENIDNGCAVELYGYDSIMKCAKRGVADGQDVCNALEKAKNYSGYIITHLNIKDTMTGTKIIMPIREREFQRVLPDNSLYAALCR